jgi:C-terminal processing protease CtpA/Prc
MSSLGLRYFSRFRVTFDFPGECLYLRQGIHYDKPEPRATSGLVLKWIDGEARVDSLRDGGPAATVGVQPGDVLLQIDETLARDYDPFALRELLTSRGGRTVALAVRRGERQINFELVLDND